MTHVNIGAAVRPLVAAFVFVLPAVSGAQDDGVVTLHVRIDQAISAGNVAPVAGPASEAELVRRLYLDLTGRIPSASEARSYLSSADAQKRSKLIDELLGTRESALHLADSFDVWLMERRSDAHVKTAAWRKYLTDSFAANKPYNQLAREILSADGSEEKGGRTAARFYLDRLGEPHLVTRDVGRLFFGKDLQCAQCHDHPNVSDYLQRDYYALFAFYTRTSFFHPDTKKPSLLSEKAAGEATFKSVFTEVKGSARPRLPGGGDFEEPTFKAGEEYKVKPNPKDKKVRPIPHYSRREQLAKLATDGTNVAFNRNIANHLWSLMMGRSLLEPSDMAHARNPPAHSALLDLLAAELVAMKFDVRAFLRELALTETYARSFELPATLADHESDLRAKLPDMEAEVSRLRELAREASAAFATAKKSWESGTKELDGQIAKLPALEKAREAAAAAKKKADEPLAKARASLAAKEGKLVPLREAEAKTAEAVKGFPEDKELVAAAAKFKKRSEQLRAEVAKFQSEMTPKQKAADEAGAKLAAASAGVEAQKKLVAGEKAVVAAAGTELENARARFQGEQAAAVRADRRVESARELVAYATAARGAIAAKQTSERLGTELAEKENRANVELKFADDLEEATKRTTAALEGKPGDEELSGALEILQKRSASARDRAKIVDEEIRAERGKYAEAFEKVGPLVEARDVARESLTRKWSASFALGAFAPLSPEQLCASTLRATGEWAHTVAAVEADFEKKLAEAAKIAAEPPKQEGEEKKEEKKKPEPPKLTEADRARYLEEQCAAKFKGAYDRFVRLFGGQPGQPQADFYATADQALFFENDGLVRSWLRPKGENLTARLLKLEDPAQIAEELYLSTVTRAPSEEEQSKVRAYLASREKDKSNAIQELSWALVSSVEFRFKH